MNKPALLHLASLLRKPLPEKTKFSLGIWFFKNKCGIQCCACGLAASNPWFIRRGLKISPYNDIFYNGFWGISAASRFFRLLPFEADYLFSLNSYLRSNRRDVAQRIENFVKRGKMPRRVEA